MAMALLGTIVTYACSFKKSIVDILIPSSVFTYEENLIDDMVKHIIVDDGVKYKDFMNAIRKRTSNLKPSDVVANILEFNKKLDTICRDLKLCDSIYTITGTTNDRVYDYNVLSMFAILYISRDRLEHLDHRIYADSIYTSIKQCVQSSHAFGLLSSYDN
jgi:hypothetical protein